MGHREPGIPGDVYVIEVNASCYLERSSELARAAAEGGVDYTALVARIVAAALARRGLTPEAKKPRKRRPRVRLAQAV